MSCGKTESLDYLSTKSIENEVSISIRNGKDKYFILVNPMNMIIIKYSSNESKYK